jgi:hypothetical protein
MAFKNKKASFPRSILFLTQKKPNTVQQNAHLICNRMIYRHALRSQYDRQSTHARHNKAITGQYQHFNRRITGSTEKFCPLNRGSLTQGFTVVCRKCSKQ